jgi:uncharacterized protein (TIGR03083 family)
VTALDPVDVGTIVPIRRGEAMSVAAAEDTRMIDLLRSLDPDDWNRPTDCDRWDVRAMVAHLAGATKDAASVPRTLRHQVAGARLAKKLGLSEPLDGVNELQVREHAHLSPDELVDELERSQPRGRRGRARVPALMRRIRISATGMKFTLGELVDVIYTRDVWMHRVDITRATGRPLVLTAAHDGRLVADLVAEWARRHGRPFDLTLTGAAGGHFVAGSEGETLALDAVEFCRILASRAEGTGLLGHKAMF